MPRDGAGTYTLPAGNPVVDGTIIDTAWANPTMSDFAVQFNNVLTRDGVLGPNLPFKFINGTAAVPGTGFVGAPTTGFWWPGAGQLGVSIIGVAAGTFQSTGWNGNVAFPLGTALLPTVGPTGDPNTGMWSPAADTLAWSTNGVECLRLDTTAFTTTLPRVGPLGAVGAPAYTFTGDLNTGMWSAGADTINFSTGGVLRGTIGSAGNWTIAAPSSGVAATINGFNGSAGLTVQDSLIPRINLDVGGNQHAYLNYSEALVAMRVDSDGAIILAPNNTAAMTFATTGAVTIAAPSSGGHSINGQLLNASNSTWGTNSNTFTFALQGGNAGAGSFGVNGAAIALRGSATGFNDLGMELYTGGAERLRLTADGRLYGTALHNNAGAVTGTTTQYIASGTYTPTLTNVTNIDSSTSAVCQWMRVGNVVTVSGVVTVDTTSGTSSFTELGVSLPIPSALTLQTQLGGAGQIAQSAGVGAYGDTTNDRAQLWWASPASTSNALAFHFTYVVL